jgi:hypothetical protein
VKEGGTGGEAVDRSSERTNLEPETGGQRSSAYVTLRRDKEGGRRAEVSHGDELLVMGGESGNWKPESGELKPEKLKR